MTLNSDQSERSRRVVLTVLAVTEMFEVERAEAERLRAALKRIAAHRIHRSSLGADTEEMRQIAADALNSHALDEERPDA
jgi:hypothetical protein